jgi:hypothetical protein
MVRSYGHEGPQHGRRRSALRRQRSGSAAGRVRPASGDQQVSELARSSEPGRPASRATGFGPSTTIPRISVRINSGSPSMSENRGRSHADLLTNVELCERGVDVAGPPLDASGQRATRVRSVRPARRKPPRRLNAQNEGRGLKAPTNLSAISRREAGRATAGSCLFTCCPAEGWPGRSLSRSG